MNNIFTELINVLNSVQVAGESNMSKMCYVLQTLHQMEAASNEPEVKEDG